MAKQFDNTNSFTLFKNNKKTQDSHSDYNGTVNIDGVEYWLNGWIREPKSGGQKFIGGSIKPKQGGGQKTAQSRKPEPDNEPFGDDSDVPF